MQKPLLPGTQLPNGITLVLISDEDRLPASDAIALGVRNHEFVVADITEINLVDGWHWAATNSEFFGSAVDAVNHFVGLTHFEAAGVAGSLLSFAADAVRVAKRNAEEQQ